MNVQTKKVRLLKPYAGHAAGAVIEVTLPEYSAVRRMGIATSDLTGASDAKASARAIAEPPGDKMVHGPKRVKCRAQSTAKR